MQRDGHRQMEDEGDACYKHRARDRYGYALTPLQCARAADSERDQRAKQGDRPASEGANGPLLKQRLRNERLHYSTGQQAMPGYTYLVPKLDGCGSNEHSLACRPGGVEFAIEHIHKADARDRARFNAEIDEVTARFAVLCVQQPPWQSRDRGSSQILADIEMAHKTILVWPYIG